MNIILVSYPASLHRHKKCVTMVTVTMETKSTVTVTLRLYFGERKLHCEYQRNKVRIQVLATTMMEFTTMVTVSMETITMTIVTMENRSI